MALLFDIRNPTAQLSYSELSDVPLVVRGVNFGPFAVLKLNLDNVKWTSLKFSRNGKQLLISSDTSNIRVINSITAAVEEIFGSKFLLLWLSCHIFFLQYLNSFLTIQGRKNTLNIPIDASFTPNDEYILSGSTDGNVFIFRNNKQRVPSIDHERKLVELQSLQPEAITSVEMNPKCSLMATASSYVAFWAPNTQ